MSVGHVLRCYDGRVTARYSSKCKKRGVWVTFDVVTMGVLLPDIQVNVKREECRSVGHV